MNRSPPPIQDTFARSGLLTLGDQLVWAQALKMKTFVGAFYVENLGILPEFSNNSRNSSWISKL